MARILDSLAGDPAVRGEVVAGDVPRVRVYIGSSARTLAVTRASLGWRLSQYGLDDGYLLVSPLALPPGEETIVADRLRTALGEIA